MYPTPLPELPPPARTRQRTGPGSYSPIQRAPSPATVAAGPTPTSAAQPDTTTTAASSSSPSRSSRRASAAAIAQAAPAAVTSALGWFSASARAALIGTGTGAGVGHYDSAAAAASAPTGAEASLVEEQEQEIRMVELVKAQGKKPFEGWMLEFEALPEGHNSRNRRPSASDDSEMGLSPPSLAPLSRKEELTAAASTRTTSAAERFPPPRARLHAATNGAHPADHDDRFDAVRDRGAWRPRIVSSRPRGRPSLA